MEEPQNFQSSEEGMVSYYNFLEEKRNLIIGQKKKWVQKELLDLVL